MPKLHHLTKHGMSKTRTYKSWGMMKSRCLNPKFDRYYDYGGRGIKICNRWLKFENFLEDMGQAPAGKSLDRKNNDGDYTPSNCRWATPRQQSNNTRSNKNIEYQGTIKSVAEWSRTLGINVETLYTRLSEPGWDINRALSEIPITHPGGGG